MYSGPEICDLLLTLGVTHVVWVPDSELGLWDEALSDCDRLDLIRVCREGEAWPLAAGLLLGGARPVVMMQTTGLFESGDAMRNVVFDLRLPLFAIVGHRSYLVEGSPDTARKFAEPILAAWGIDHVLIGCADDKPRLAEHYHVCAAAGKAGIVLIAEGRM